MNLVICNNNNNNTLLSLINILLVFVCHGYVFPMTSEIEAGKVWHTITIPDPIIDQGEDEKKT